MTRSHNRTIGVNELMQGSGNVEDTIDHATPSTSQIPSCPNDTPTIDSDSTIRKIDVD